MLKSYEISVSLQVDKEKVIKSTCSQRQIIGCFIALSIIWMQHYALRNLRLCQTLLIISHYIVLIFNKGVPNGKKFDYYAMANFIHNNILYLIQTCSPSHKEQDCKEQPPEKAYELITESIDIINDEGIHEVKQKQTIKANKIMTYKTIHYIDKLSNSADEEGPPSLYSCGPHEHTHIFHKNDAKRYSSNSKISKSQFLQQKLLLRAKANFSRWGVPYVTKVLNIFNFIFKIMYRYNENLEYDIYGNNKIPSEYTLDILKPIKYISPKIISSKYLKDTFTSQWKFVLNLFEIDLKLFPQTSLINKDNKLKLRLIQQFQFTILKDNEKLIVKGMFKSKGCIYYVVKTLYSQKLCVI